MTGNAIIVDTDTNDNAEGFCDCKLQRYFIFDGTTTGGLQQS